MAKFGTYKHNLDIKVSKKIMSKSGWVWQVLTLQVFVMFWKRAEILITARFY